MARYTQDKGPLVTEDVLFYAPTPPVRLQRVLTESAPTAALVVALPEGEVLGNSHKEAFFLRLIQIATRYVDVLVLINRDEPLAILKIKELIARHISDSDRVLKRVIFFRGMIDTEWVRDYGPLFGLGDDNRLVLLDNMYRDLRSEGRTERMLLSLGFVKTVEEPTRMSQPANPEVRANGQYLSDYGEFWRRNDDAAPLYFNEFLYLQTHRFSPLVRPPLELSGGDLAFTESGQMFTSTRTLELNGGEERRFSRLVREYFNVDHVSYLRPLPNSIWHIDMFFRIASPRVVMLGDFSDAGKSESGYLKLLHREAKEILEWNRVLIEERLPGVEVVRVPMPPIVQPNGRPASAGRTGIAELDSAIETTGARLKPLSTVVYRSFLNSVFINRGRGHSVVLVPTFSGLRGMESRVREAYHRAYPGADVHFINADALAEDFGGIHCVTLTIPALAYRPL
jgi:agmatine/peptidylarginine deiminase